MRGVLKRGCLVLALGWGQAGFSSDKLESPCAHLPAEFFQNENLQSRHSGQVRYPVDQSGKREKFVVGGQNRLDDLLHTETVAGSRIEDLEKRMWSHGHGHVIDSHPMFEKESWKGMSHPALRASSGGFLGIAGGMQLDAPNADQRKMVESLSGKLIQEEIQQLAKESSWLDSDEREQFSGKLPMLFAPEQAANSSHGYGHSYSLSFEEIVNQGLGSFGTVDVSLRQLLIRDELKSRQLGADHQQIAAPLLQIIESFENQVTEEKVKVPLTKKVKVGEKEYTIEGHSMAIAPSDGIQTERSFRSGWREEKDYPGVQGSPFCDGLFASWYMKITDENGKELWIDALTPHLIHRYGFYQGGKYRVPPEDIAEFFGLGKAAAKKVKPEKPAPIASEEQHQL